MAGVPRELSSLDVPGGSHSGPIQHATRDTAFE